MSKLEPAATIISRFNGPGNVARVLGVDRSAVWRWTQPKQRGGTDGIVPRWHVAKLLAHAQAHEIDLTAASFAPVVEASAQPAPESARASL